MRSSQATTAPHSKSVFLFVNSVPHYIAAAYEQINLAVGGTLVVCHGSFPGRSFLLDPEPSCGFSSVWLTNWWLKGGVIGWQFIHKPFRIYGRPAAVICAFELRLLSTWWLLAYCRLRSIPFAFWGHAGSRRRRITTSSHIKDRILRWFIRRADAFISYTKGERDKLTAFYDPRQIFVAQNTINIMELSRLRKSLELEGREHVKQRIGLRSLHYLCYIGQLVASKQPHLCLDVLGLLQDRGISAGLIFIGEGDQRNQLEAIVQMRGLTDVHFVGAIASYTTSAPYLFASDVLLNPGAVGLSVNHAFSFGLAVVTQRSGTAGPFHGPEAEYITHGRTGYLVNQGDLIEMCSSVLSVFGNRELYSRATIEYAEQELSLDRMVTGVTGAIKFLTDCASN